MKKTIPFFFFFCFVFVALNRGLISPVLQKLLKILLLKKRSKTSCTCCIRFSLLFFVLFFHDLFQMLAKILLVEATYGCKILIVAPLVFDFFFSPPIFTAFITAERNNILLVMLSFSFWNRTEFS